MNMSLRELWEMVKDREAWHALVHGVTKSRTWPGNWTATMCLTLMTPWTAAHPAPLSMGFPRQEYWNGLPFTPLEDLPDAGIKPASPSLQVDPLPLRHQGSPYKFFTRFFPAVKETFLKFQSACPVKFKLITTEQNLNFSFSFILATFQVLNSHMWSMDTILVSADIQHFQHCRKFQRGLVEVVL